MLRDSVLLVSGDCRGGGGGNVVGPEPVGDPAADESAGDESAGDESAADESADDEFGPFSIPEAATESLPLVGVARTLRPTAGGKILQFGALGGSSNRSDTVRVAIRWIM